jgi:hypothetical protein
VCDRKYHTHTYSPRSREMLLENVMAKKPPATERLTLSFKVPPRLKEAIEEAARLDDRTVSSLVQHLLAREMRARKLLK